MTAGRDEHTLKTAAIIVAGGSGSRLGGEIPKQYRLLKGTPVLVRTIDAMSRAPSVGLIVVVVPEAEKAGFFDRYCEPYLHEKVGAVRAGGPTRLESVARGLSAVDESCDLVAVHDGVRPLVSVELIERCIMEAERSGAAVPGIPLTDTIKSVDKHRKIISTVPREGLWAVQTPQVFRRDILTAAYDKAFREGFSGTDDASLVERAGFSVTVIEGSTDNLKITYEKDIMRAEAILSAENTKL